MELVYWCSKAIICALEVYMIYDLFSFTFKAKSENKNHQLFIAILLFISIIIINYFEIPVLNILGGIVFVSIFGKLIFEASISICLGYSVLFHIISACSEVAGEFLFSILYHNDKLTDENFSFNLFLIIMIEKIITFIILKLIQFFSKRHKSKLEKELLKGFMVLPITTLFILYGIIKFDFYEDLLFIQLIILGAGCILLLFSNVFVYYLLERFSAMMRRARELDIMNAKAEMERTHYKILEEINQEHLKYIHDMNKNLSTIARLTEERKSQEVLGILDKLNIQIVDIQKKEYCQDSVMNGILGDRISTAVKQGIKFDVYFSKTISMDRIDDLDKIAMIGNLLDNAIEAAAKCKGDRNIEFEISHGNEGYLVIKIRNTYQEAPKLSGNVFVTNKQDKYNHGIGIKIVKELAEKYSGELKTRIEGNEFIVTLYLSVMGKSTI